MKKKKEVKKPNVNDIECPRCGWGRWKTVVPGKKWKCTHCGYINTKKYVEEQHGNVT